MTAGELYLRHLATDPGGLDRLHVSDRCEGSSRRVEFLSQEVQEFLHRVVRVSGKPDLWQQIKQVAPAQAQDRGVDNRSRVDVLVEQIHGFL